MRTAMTDHPAHVSFASIRQDGSADPLSAAPLRTLLACTETGRLFAPWEAQLTKSTPSLAPGAARTFYCSLCPGSALRITADAQIASCGACGWTAARAGVRSMPDLFARDAEPWPLLGARITELVSAHAPRPPPRTRPPPPRTVAASIAADTAADASLRGLRISADADTTPVTRTDPTEEEYVHVRDLITLDVPLLAGDIRRRDALPPRRRLPPPRMGAVSPYSSRPVCDAVLDNPSPRDNAAAFLPAVEHASVAHDCAGRARALHVNFQLRNVRRVGIRVRASPALHYRDDTDDEKADSTSAHIPPGETHELQLRVHAEHVPHGEPALCALVAPVILSVRFDSEEAGTEYATMGQDGKPFWMHEWRYTMYVRHARRKLRGEEKKRPCEN